VFENAIAAPAAITPTAVVCCENTSPDTAMPSEANASCHLRSQRSANQVADSAASGLAAVMTTV
jgi:hypothetical protein